MIVLKEGATNLPPLTYKGYLIWRDNIALVNWCITCQVGAELDELEKDLVLIIQRDIDTRVGPRMSVSDGVLVEAVSSKGPIKATAI